MNTQSGNSVIDRRRLLAAGGSMLLALSGMARAQDWPNRPITMIFSWAPGGNADAVCRVMAEHLSKSLGQPVVVENRVGASGRIGTLAVVRAKPDGYTLLFAAPSELSVAAATVETMPYDPISDLQPITQVMTGPYILAASPAFPPNNLSEMIAYAKANPGKVNYASFGNNTLNHLYGAQLNAVTGMDTIHVPYKVSSMAHSDMMTGLVQYMFDNASAVLPHIKAGKLKAIAVMAPQRMTIADTIPTMAESGVPNVGTGTWLGILAPAKTPKPIVDKLNAELKTILKSPEVAKVFESRGIQPMSSTPDEFGNMIQSEEVKWKQLVAKLGLKLD